MIRQEVNLLERLMDHPHPNICQTRHIAQDEDHLFVVMDMGTLGTLL